MRFSATDRTSREPREERALGDARRGVRHGVARFFTATKPASKRRQGSPSLPLSKAKLSTGKAKATPKLDPTAMEKQVKAMAKEWKRVLKR